MLPRDETSFFGRGAELEEIERRFASGARLVSIVGVGGVGKTRLALEAAARTPGAAFVALAGARTLEAAVRATAGAVGAKVSAESKATQGLAAVAKAIARAGAALLVLDNVEQLGAAGETLVTAILDEAREARILATSREPIGARGEEKVLLAPLADEDARAMFLERARTAAGGAVEMRDEDVAAIVARVDRLPLAIELAASRLGLLTAPELLRRLSERIDVLADARATMRATLDWSWDLLGDAEKSALVQLSVFAAPFGIEAAEDVLALEGVEPLDVVEGLLRRSLIVRADAGSGRARLRMFETVRSWAREKIDPASGVLARHAAHVFGEAKSWAARTYGEDGVRALDALGELLPEVIAAFEATRERDPAAAADGVLALTDLLLFRGLFELRADVLARAVDTAERAGDPALLARALVAKARVTLEVGKMTDAETELRRALDLAAGAGDETTRAEATRSLGWALTAMARLAEAEDALERARAMHRAQGSARGEADAHVALGILRAFQGKPDAALAHLRDALAIHVERGDVVRQEKVLGFAPLVGQDAREVARGLPREVLARAPEASLDRLPDHVAAIVATEREAGERWRHAIALYRDGAAAHARGEHAAAVDAFDRALAALARAGVMRGSAVVHGHAAVALAALGDLAEADARLARARAVAADDPASELALALHASAVELLRTRGATGTARDAAMREARAMLDRAAHAEAAPPDVLVARRVVEDLLEASPVSLRASTDEAHALVVGRDARWMTPPGGARVDLVRYGPVRRLLDRLVEERLARPGTALSAEQLIDAGWPGERMRHSAGLLRVYSAIRRLRRLGLEPLLVTRDDGYLLDARAPVRREA